MIHIARGSVIDEQALVANLEQYGIAGAGLDVFTDEPRVPASLLTMNQVVLQPHHGSGPHSTRKEMARLTLANVHAFFSGEQLPSPYPLTALAQDASHVLLRAST